MRALDRRVAAIGRVVTPVPDQAFLAYARAVVVYGGGRMGSDGFERAAVGMARWLESGRRGTLCWPS